MSSDPTEAIRREMVVEINSKQAEREAMEAEHRQVWDTQELTRDFDVHAFAAPFVMVTRKADKVKGAMLFQHHPRYYFDFQPAK